MLRREEHRFSSGKGPIQVRTRHSRYFGQTLLFIFAVLLVPDINAQQNWVSVSSTATGYVVHCATNPQNTAFPGGANAPTLNIIPFGGKLFAVGQLNNDCPIPPHSSGQQISPVLSISADGGKSWSPSPLKGTFDPGSSAAFANVPSSGFAIGDQLFITYVYGGNSGGIASSKDGLTWGPTVASPDCETGNLTGFAKNTTFVLQCGNAVLTSADNGMTWREPLPGAFLPTGSVATWCIYGSDVILCGNFVQPPNDLNLPQFFRSRDLGITWESIEIPLARPNTNSQYVKAFLGSADALFIQLQPFLPYSGLSETMFLYSTDGGTSWHFESLPFLSITLVASPLDKRLWIFPNPVGLGSGLKGVTRYFGFFQSQDEGQSWSGATAGLPDTQGISSLYVSGNWLETVYLSTSDSRSLWVKPLGTQH